MEDIFLTTAHGKGFTSSFGKTKLFVGGLPLHACDQNLAKHFRKYGPLDTIEVQRNPDGKSRGFAFIEFMRPADARKALQSGPHDILGKTVSLQIALESNVAASMTKSRQSRKLYLTGIPQEVQESELLAALNHVGSVEKLISPRFGVQSRGFCYVIMNTVQDYQNLIQKGKILLRSSNGEIHTLRVESAVSLPNTKGSERKETIQVEMSDQGEKKFFQYQENPSWENKSNLNDTGKGLLTLQSANPVWSPLPIKTTPQKPEGISQSNIPGRTAKFVRHIVSSGVGSLQDIPEEGTEPSKHRWIKITRKLSIEDVCSFPRPQVSESNSTFPSQDQGGVFYGTQPTHLVMAQSSRSDANYRFNLRAH